MTVLVNRGLLHKFIPYTYIWMDPDRKDITRRILATLILLLANQYNFLILCQYFN